MYVGGALDPHHHNATLLVLGSSRVKLAPLNVASACDLDQPTDLNLMHIKPTVAIPNRCPVITSSVLAVAQLQTGKCYPGMLPSQPHSWTRSCSASSKSAFILFLESSYSILSECMISILNDFSKSFHVFSYIFARARFPKPLLRDFLEVENFFMMTQTCKHHFLVALLGSGETR